MMSVDGFTVERDGDTIILTFSDMLGDIECYEFPVEDAFKIAAALTQHSVHDSM